MLVAAKPANELQRLLVLRSYGLLDTECETNLDSVVALAAQLTGASASMISLIDDDRQWFKARFGLQIPETPRDAALCAHAILTPDTPMIVNDTHQDPRFADNPLVTGEPWIRFYAAQPLVNADGLPLGTLCVIDPRPRDLTDDQRYTLKVLADSVMTTLEFRRLARIDRLTGLPNQIALAHATDQAIEAQRQHGRRFALLDLGLAGFAPIRDREGDEAADHLLRRVARLLAASLDDQDMVARIDTDAFAILMRHDPQTMEAATAIRGAIADALADDTFPVTVSIGAVTFLAPPASVEAAFRLASEARHAAWSAGPGQIVHRMVDIEPSSRAPARNAMQGP